MKKLFDLIEEIYNSDLKLVFNKKINVKERFFLNFLLNTSLKRKKIILEIEKSFFIEELKEENIERFLKLFFEKKIILKKSNGELFGILNLISCFLFNNNKYIFFVSETIYDYLISNNNLIIKYQLELLLKLNNENIENLFFYLLINLKKSNEIILTKKEIKNILSLDKEYSRFFDLENKFILPTLTLIKELCNLDIKYIKIKNTKSINSKISYLKFLLPNDNLLDDNKKIISLLKNYQLKEDTKLFTLQMIVKKSFKYVLENVYYFIDHVEGDLDTFLLNCLNNDLANTYFITLLNSKIKDTKILVQLTTTFNTIKEFEKTVKKLISENSSTEIKELILLHTTFKEIITDNYDKMTKNKKNNFLYDYNELLYQLENIHISKRFFYENSSFIFLAEFNTYKESYIYILKKESLIEDYLYQK